MTGRVKKRTEGLWFLEGLTEENGTIRRIPILLFPFTIGRRAGAGLTLDANEISGQHAELFRDGRRIMLRDLGSTNGTFVNGDRLRGETQVRKGDLVHFARSEFRLGVVDSREAESLLAQTIAVDTDLPHSMLDKGRILEEMMKQRAVVSVFQPIVDFSDRKLVAYEILGRGDMNGESAGSSELFSAARLLGAEAALSRLFRERSAVDCMELATPAKVFINTHPKEIGTGEFVQSLESFREATPDLDAVLEIHEGAVTDPGEMEALNRILRKLRFQLAYDDFGAGQARLVELAEVPPDYLKFDISMIRDIDSAPKNKRTVLGRLVEMASELGIATIAEGVESEAEAEICVDLGFKLGQGFLFGVPGPAGGPAPKPAE